MGRHRSNRGVIDRQQAEALIAELGRQLGIPELALDDDGVATLALDEGGTIVSLGHAPDAGTLDLMICLDEVVPAGAALAEAFAANFGWGVGDGACFALEPTSGALVLQRRCTAEDGPHLHDILEGMVLSAEAWARRLGPRGCEPAAEPVAVRFGHLAIGALRA